ncbi:unnamed protein product [Orchesella dallaii]|uniref:Uncharacterized protein n=1 Tax=Orchesella dallaii TaxID=48710 RepID=A0ABP1RJ25_9HEXA
MKEDKLNEQKEVIEKQNQKLAEAEQKFNTKVEEIKSKDESLKKNGGILQKQYQRIAELSKELDMQKDEVKLNGDKVLQQGDVIQKQHEKITEMGRKLVCSEDEERAISEQLRLQRETLNRQGDEITDVCKQLANATKEIEAKEKVITEMEQMVAEKVEKLTEANKLLKQMTDKSNGHLATIHRRNERIDALNKQIEQQDLEINRQSSLIAESKKVICQLESQDNNNRKNCEQVSRLKAENLHIDSLLKQRDDQMTRLQLLLNESTLERDQLFEANKLLTQDNQVEKLNQQLANLDSANKIKQEKIAELEKNITNLTQEREQMLTAISKLDEKAKGFCELEENINQLGLERDRLVQLNSTQEEAIKQLHECRESLRQEKETLLEEKDNEIAQLIGTKTSLEMAKQQVEAEMEELKQKEIIYKRQKEELSKLKLALKSYKTKNAKQRDHIKERDDELKQREAEIADLKERVNQHRDELENQQDLMVNNQTELEDLKANFENKLKEKLADLQAKHAELQSQIRTPVTEDKGTDAQFELTAKNQPFDGNLAAKCESLQGKIQNLIAKNKKKYGEVRWERQKRENLEKGLARRDKKINDQREHIIDLELERNALQAVLLTVEILEQAESEKMVRLQSKLKQYKAQVAAASSSTTAALEAEVKKLNLSHTQLTSDLEKTTKAFTELYEEVIALKESKTESEQEISKLQQEIETSEKMMKELKLKNEKYQEDITELAKKIKTLTETSKEVNDRYSSLCNTHNETLSQKQALELEYSELKEKMVAATESQKKVSAAQEKELTERKAQLKKKAAEIATLKEKAINTPDSQLIERQQQEILSGRRLIEQLQREIAVKTKQHSQLEQNLVNLRHDKKEVDCQLETLDKQHSELCSQLNAEKAMVECLNEEKAEAEEKILALQKSKDSLEQTIKKLKLQVDNLEREIRPLKNKLREQQDLTRRHQETARRFQQGRSNLSTVTAQIANRPQSANRGNALTQIYNEHFANGKMGSVSDILKPLLSSPRLNGGAKAASTSPPPSSIESPKPGLITIHNLRMMQNRSKSQTREEGEEMNHYIPEVRKRRKSTSAAVDDYTLQVNNEDRMLLRYKKVLDEAPTEDSSDTSPIMKMLAARYTNSSFTNGSLSSNLSNISMQAHVKQIVSKMNKKRKLSTSSSPRTSRPSSVSSDLVVIDLTLSDEGDEVNHADVIIKHDEDSMPKEEDDDDDAIPLAKTPIKN